VQFALNNALTIVHITTIPTHYAVQSQQYTP